MPLTLNGTTGLTFNDTSLQTKAVQATGTAPGYAVRAWANIDCSGGGAGVAAVRTTANITSLTDDGVGRYTLALTSAMADSNFVMVSSYGYDTASGDQRAHVFLNNTPTSGSFSVGNIFANVSYTEIRRSCTAILR